jgi:hypothetical protein
MTVDFIPLNGRELKECFEYDDTDGRLYRRANSDRYDGIDVTDQKLVRLNDKRVPTVRVLYYFQTGKLPKGEVMLNDVGELVDVVDNHFRTMLAYRGSPHARLTNEGRYCGRYVTRTGVRHSRTFDTVDEAKDWSSNMTYDVWSSKAKELGFVL